MANQDIGNLEKQWGELEAAGIPLEPPENRIGVNARNSGSVLTIRAGSDRWRSEIRELRNGRFAYLLPIFIRRDRPGKTIIRDAWIAAPWLDTTIEFLDDPKEGPKPGCYAFPDDESFQRSKVLNHRLHCVLARGDIREGLVVAVGLRPPDSYKNRDRVQVTFGILDQWDLEHTAQLEMRMNRLPTQAKQIITSTRGPLLSRRDVLPSSPPLVALHDPTSESRAGETAADQSTLKDVVREQSKPKRAKMPTDGKTRAH